VVTTDAGNFGGWPARFLRWKMPGTFLGPTSGAMGYAVPAAIAARLARPERPALALVGDGGFLMTGAEVETAVRERAPIVVLVFDNAQYGTIRMHQERHHPGRPVATALGPVDFAAIARALGADGSTIRDEAEFAPAVCDALRSERSTVLHLPVDPEQLSVGQDASE
jgi:acetolactate synthase-1/2/3 large subunit